MVEYMENGYEIYGHFLLLESVSRLRNIGLLIALSLGPNS